TNETIAGVRPFSGQTPEAIIQNVLRDDARPLAYQPSDVIGDELVTFIHKAWTKDASARPTAGATVGTMQRLALSFGRDPRIAQPSDEGFGASQTRPCKEPPRCTVDAALLQCPDLSLFRPAAQRHDFDNLGWLADQLWKWLSTE